MPSAPNLVVPIARKQRGKPKG